MPARTFLGAAAFFVVVVDLAAGLAAALVAGFLGAVVADLGLAAVLDGGLEF